MQRERRLAQHQGRGHQQAHPEGQPLLKMSAEAGNSLRREHRITTPAPLFQLPR
jgi:hypothetical protein